MQMLKHENVKFGKFGKVNLFCRFLGNPAGYSWPLPSVHLDYEGLFNGDPAAVDDHTLGVRQVPVVGVLELYGVNHSLAEETHRLDVNGRFHLKITEISHDRFTNSLFYHI